MAQATELDQSLPTLTYFGLHAKAEPIRMLLKHKGVAFNDTTITFEQWAEIKQTTPSGQIPTYQLPNGKVLNQANAILRLLGRQHGYYFNEEAEAYNVDWALETHADFWATKTQYVFFGGKEQEAITKGLKQFEKFNKQIETHLAGTNTRFMASDRLTIADFLVFQIYMGMCHNEATIVPEIQAQFAGKLADTPKVTAYIEVMKTEMASYLATRGAYKI